MQKKKVIFAYNGGLDTTVMLKWLMKQQGYQVIAYVANIGQETDFKKIRQKAMSAGASDLYVEDLREELVTDFIFPALQGNALYEGRYLLGTPLTRFAIARKQIELALREKASYVAHGSTGRGNNQVRFELTYYALNPDIHVIAPWRAPEFQERFQTHADLLAYVQEMGIPANLFPKRPYYKENHLIHTGYKAGILENPAKILSEDLLRLPISPKNAPDHETLVDIEFKNGLPVKVTNRNTGTIKETPLELFSYLNTLGKENGIGRVDMVQNRYLGSKSRGIYDAPGATILHKAHLELEGIAMDKEVMHLRNMLIPKFSQLIHHGYWFSPEIEFLLNVMRNAQEFIQGTVSLSLYKGNVITIGRQSPTSLYDQELSSMDIGGGFNQEDSQGFIRINAARLMTQRSATISAQK